MPCAEESAPETVDIVQESWPSYEHVNVQAGLDAWLAESARVHEVVGLVNYRHRDFGFADMLRSDSSHGHENGPMPGNVARINLPSGPDGAVRACVECAVYLVAEGDRRAALFVRRGGDDMGRAQTSLEVVATQQGYAEQVAAEVRAAALVHNVYRGQVVSFDGDMFGERSTVLSFNVRSTMSADQLILPPETLAAISTEEISQSTPADSTRCWSAQQGSLRRSSRSCSGALHSSARKHCPSTGQSTTQRASNDCLSRSAPISSTAPSMSSWTRATR